MAQFYVPAAGTGMVDRIGSRPTGEVKGGWGWLLTAK